MNRKFNYSHRAESDNDTDSEGVKKSFKKEIWRQTAEKYRKKEFRQLSMRHQQLIEDYFNLQLGQQANFDDVLVNEIKNGKISFAYEGLETFPGSLVEILRHDITHLDLSANNIRNLEFLRGFKSLKSLIIDENTRVDMDSLPQLDSLELFYANKCRIEFPRSFISRVSVVFKSLKYLSMMYNPVMKRPKLAHIWKGKDRRMRMFAVFMNPNLIHFNDKHVDETERQHAERYHKYLGPSDYKLSEFKILPDTDDVRSILPAHIRDQIADLEEMEFQAEAERVDEALSSISISQYFTNYRTFNGSISSLMSSDDQSSTADDSPCSFYTDEGIGSSAPSENLYFD